MTDHITIPIDVAEAAAEALGNFVSDHGWSDSDMQAMDNLDAYIARHKAIRAELAKPVGPATAPKPAAWINGHDLRLLGRQGRGALVWCDNEGNADTPLYLHPPTPAWHDAPEVAALKAERDAMLELLVFAASIIKSEYPESQWDEYRIPEIDAAIAKRKDKL